MVRSRTTTRPPKDLVRPFTSMTIDGSEAVIDVDVDGAIATDQTLLEKGTCP